MASNKYAYKVGVKPKSIDLSKQERDEFNKIYRKKYGVKINYRKYKKKENK